MAKRNYLELHFLDETTQVSLAELVSASGLDIEQLVELVEYGIFDPVNREPVNRDPVHGEPSNREPVDRGAPGGAARSSQDHPAVEWHVSSRSLYVARRAARLTHDFGLDASGVALTLSLLERIEELERKLHDLNCHLPR